MHAESSVCIADVCQAGLPWEGDKQPFAWEERTPADRETGSDDSDQEPVQQAVPSTSGRRPVWEDTDDAAAQVNIAAQPRLRKLRKTERDSIVSGRCFEDHPLCRPCCCLLRSYCTAAFLTIRQSIVTHYDSGTEP